MKSNKLLLEIEAPGDFLDGISIDAVIAELANKDGIFSARILDQAAPQTKCNQCNECRDTGYMCMVCIDKGLAAARVAASPAAEMADEIIDRLHSGGKSILELCTKEYSDGYRMAIFHTEQIIDWLKGDAANSWRSSNVAAKNHLLDLAGRFVSHTESFCEDSELSPEFLELLNDMREAIATQSQPAVAVPQGVSEVKDAAFEAFWHACNSRDSHTKDIQTEFEQYWIGRAQLATPPEAASAPQGVSDSEITALWNKFVHKDGDHVLNFARALLATPPEAKVQVGGKCECCGVGDIAISVECHNSSCANYAIPKTIYAGWNKPQPAAATEQHDKDSEVRG